MTAPPAVFTAGQVLTSAQQEAIMNRPVVAVGRNSTQSITTSTATAVQWNTEGFDSDGFHDNVTNNTRLTIPAGCGGIYLVSCTITWQNNATGARELLIRLNGSSPSWAGDRNSPGANVAHYNSCSFVIPQNLNAGDYIEAMVWQSSGVSLNVDNAAASGPMFSLTWLRRTV